MDFSKTATAALFDLTDQALVDGRMPEARAGLDELARRNDHLKVLGDLARFCLPTGDYKCLITDRIDLANSVAERNADVEML